MKWTYVRGFNITRKVRGAVQLGFCTRGWYIGDGLDRHWSFLAIGMLMNSGDPAFEAIIGPVHFVFGLRIVKT
jgi:hypothetical protein